MEAPVPASVQVEPQSTGVSRAVRWRGVSRLAIDPTVLALALSLTTVGVSLSLPTLLDSPPCSLCLVQRWLVMTAAAALALGLLRRSALAAAYALPITIAGMGVATYHSLLQWGFVPDTLPMCLEGVPCSEVKFMVLGFVTIPFMSACAFTALTALLSVSMWRSRNV
ncbi:MAG: disulfide bond formation protein B [Coriobacteriia bacterium]